MSVSLTLTIPPLSLPPTLAIRADALSQSFTHPPPIQGCHPLELSRTLLKPSLVLSFPMCLHISLPTSLPMP